MLGALLLEGGPEKGKFIVMLKEWVFYKEAHQVIYKAIRSLFDQDLAIDIITVTLELRRLGLLEVAGGPYYVTMLTNRVASSTNTEYHIRILQQYAMRRMLIQICSATVKEAYEDTTDVFDLLDKISRDIDTINVAKSESIVKDNRNIAENVTSMLKPNKSSAILLFYQTGWRRFDALVSLGANRIILIAGGAKMGKTRFTAAMLFHLLNRFPEVSVMWVTLEDSAEDIAIHYISTRVFVKGKDLKKHNFSSSLMPHINQAMDTWATFDIEFHDKSMNIKTYGAFFKIFCDKRPNRFNILILDNILSLNDRIEMKNDLNSFYDFAMNEVLRIRQATGGLIIPVHHFRDAQQDKDNLKDGYRPRLTDMKGTEAFRRVPNQVLLINTPGKYKDLLQEYKGEAKENLKKMFIIDVGASRDDDNIDENEGVIHMIASLDYNTFQEVDYFDPTKGVGEGKNVYFAPIDPEVLAAEGVVIKKDEDELPPF